MIAGQRVLQPMTTLRGLGAIVVWTDRNREPISPRRLRRNSRLPKKLRRRAQVSGKPSLERSYSEARK